ncbi:MAG: tetratricopeptide repeat protein [Pseudomonadales bacterium]|nr:tetratricopeptide repeat protein [Pseudomonadales bacterium]
MTRIMRPHTKQTSRFHLTSSFLFCISLVLGACSSNPIPPPITDANDRAPIERTSPGEQTPAQANTSAATAQLLAQANDSLQADDQASAITYLERAIRIAPRDPELWIQLAHVHLKDGNLGVAEQHARKAIALSAADEVLEHQAWLTFADVRDAQGNTAEAKSIRRRFGRFRG